LGLLFVSLSGCYPSNDSLRAKLDTRAKFDLNCNQLQLVPLEETNGHITSYGVMGCGRRATYILNTQSATWIMNVEGGQPAGSYPEQPPPPPPPAPPQ